MDVDRSFWKRHCILPNSDRLEPCVPVTIYGSLIGRDRTDVHSTKVELIESEFNNPSGHLRPDPLVASLGIAYEHA